MLKASNPTGKRPSQIRRLLLKGGSLGFVVTRENDPAVL